MPRVLPAAAALILLGAASVPPAPLPAALRAAARALALWQSNALWPETSEYPIPVALRADSDVAYLIEHPKPPEGATPLPDTPGVMKWIGHDLPPAATTHAVNGVPTAVVPLDMLAERSFPEAVGLVGHEMFHALQQMRGFGEPENILLMAEYPELDPRNNALGRIEGQLLAVALRASTNHEVGEGARDFLAIRQTRRQALSEALREYEWLAEGHEGVPQSLQLRGALAAGTDEARARGDLLARLEELCKGGEGANRRRFYWSGAALALVLDRLAPDWQHAQMEGQPLEDLLARQVAYDPAQAAVRVARVTRQYRLDDLLAEETAAAEAERARRRAWLEEILNDAPRLLVLELGDHSVQRSFDPMNIMQVDDHTTIHERFLLLRADGFEVRVEGVVIEDTRLGHYTIPIREPGEMRMGEMEVVRPDPARAIVRCRDLVFTAPGITLKIALADLDTPGDGKTTILRVPAAE